jgi:uncharacterized 2Fe-2S/4Fe-4S cluster protein (DUF4445 family)
VPFDSISRSNRQQSYGGDVISRISYAMEHGVEEITSTVQTQISEMIARVARRNGVDPGEIYRVSLVGNTTMLHLLLGVDPAGIAAAPFIPVFTEGMAVPAAQLQLEVNPAAKAHIVPSISAYVGGDITAGILSSGMMESGETSILVDVGTNGEIVLKHGDTLWACSAAAGPAFEGANIRWGTGGSDGAVDSFSLDGECCSYSTIGGEPAMGICGAGLIDIIAVLIRHGLIDDKGRLTGEPQRDVSSELRQEVKDLLEPRFIEVDGKPAFIVVPAEQTSVGEDIVLTQKDVREVQLGKGAVAAGLQTLLLHAGLEAGQVDRLYLAGGFGSFLRKESAGVIKLIPEELVERTVVAGNAAGKGALYALFSRAQSQKFELILSKSRYIELSTSQEFQKAFVDHMYF